MVIRSDYISGTVTVSAGGTVVTGVGTGWIAAEFQEGDVFIADGWRCNIASVDSNTQLTLDEDGGTRGGALAGAEYRLRYMSNGSRVSAQARELIDMLGASGNLQALGGLNGSNGDVPYFTGPGTLGVLTKADITMGVRYDAMVDTLPDRDAYDGQPIGFTVLVADTGDGRAAIYVREGGAGNWSDPAYITGPSLTLAVDQVDPLPYGDDPTVTLNSIAGGYELNFGIPQGMEIVPGTVTTLTPGSPATVDFVPVTGGYQLNFGLPKGDTGTLTGLTPFYQTQVTTAADAAAARTGLGVGTVGTINLPSVPIGDILYDDGTWGTPPEGGGYDPNIALLALEVADLKGGRMGMVGGIADPFDDESGVATKSNATYSAVNDWYSPVMSTGTPVTVSSATLDTDSLGWANYTIVVVIDASSVLHTGSGVVTVRLQAGSVEGLQIGAAYIGHAASSGDAYDFESTPTQLFFAGNSQGITIAPGQTADAQTASFTIQASKKLMIAYNVSNNPSADVVRAGDSSSGWIYYYKSDSQEADTVNKSGYATGTANRAFGVSLVQLAALDKPLDMTLTSVVYSAMTEPSIGRLTVQTSETTAITPNDDLIGEISRDGGTTWSEANLTLASSLSGIKLYEDSNIDLSVQPSGDDMVWRVRTENNVDVAVSGVVAQWKE